MVVNWSGNSLKWPCNGLKWSGNGHETARNGVRWSGNGPKLDNELGIVRDMVGFLNKNGLQGKWLRRGRETARK